MKTTDPNKFKPWAPLPAWERVIVGGLFGAVCFPFAGCLCPFEQLTEWLTMPAGIVLFVPFAAMNLERSAAYPIAVAMTTGAVLGAACTGILPLIFTGRRTG